VLCALAAKRLQPDRRITAVTFRPAGNALDTVPVTDEPAPSNHHLRAPVGSTALAEREVRI
jgi:hypothetical protein